MTYHFCCKITIIYIRVYTECSNEDMTVENIIRCALEAGLKRIALTDHHHESSHDIIKDLESIKNKVSVACDKLEVLIGSELSSYGIGKYSDSLDINMKIAYRLYACNHYHLDFWEHPEVSSKEAYARHTLEVITAPIKSKRADCIAHPFTGKFLNDKIEDHRSIARVISDNDLANIMKLGKENDVAWEINKCVVFDDPDFAKRYWNIGKEEGATFYFGTDAHSLADIDSKQYEDSIRKILI